MNVNRFFPGLQHQHGLGFMQTSGAPLGDDASVMMISGLGAQPGEPEQGVTYLPRAGTASPATTVAAPDIGTVLKTPIKIGNIELPLWTWLLLAMAAGGGLGFWAGKKL